jgi:hypothetical protein
MRKSRTFTVAFVAVGVALLVTMVWSIWTPKYHAQSRLMLEVRENHYFPSFSRDEYGFMGLFLSSPESQRALAKEGGEGEFSVTKVGPIRGTFLFYITCSASDAERVQCLASNAAQMIISFYATNQPSWQVSYIDSACFTPPSIVDRLKDFIGL